MCWEEASLGQSIHMQARKNILKQHCYNVRFIVPQHFKYCISKIQKMKTLTIGLVPSQKLIIYLFDIWISNFAAQIIICIDCVEKCTSSLVCFASQPHTWQYLLKTYAQKLTVKMRILGGIHNGSWPLLTLTFSLFSCSSLSEMRWQWDKHEMTTRWP